MGTRYVFICLLMHQLTEVDKSWWPYKCMIRYPSVIERVEETQSIIMRGSQSLSCNQPYFLAPALIKKNGYRHTDRVTNQSTNRWTKESYQTWNEMATIGLGKYQITSITNGIQRKRYSKTLSVNFIKVKKSQLWNRLLARIERHLLSAQEYFCCFWVG